MIFSHTRTGSYHISNGLPCGDCVAQLDTDEIMCIALADGVTACSRSHRGAEIAVDTVIRLFERCADIIKKLSNERICGLVSAEVRYALDTAAKSDGVPISEYSSTLAFAVHYRKSGQLLLFLLGDSAAVIYGSSGSIRIPCRPSDSGEAADTTTMRDWSAYISRTDASETRKVMLLSDGGWFCANDAICGGKCDTVENSVLSAIDSGICSDDSSFISADISAENDLIGVTI